MDFSMTIRGIDQFFAVVDAYKAATGLPDKTISSRVLNDSGRIDLLRAGGDIGIRKVAAALNWFSEHWPAGAAWPTDVARPVVNIAEGVTS
jgi:hypothetical protein